MCTSKTKNYNDERKKAGAAGKSSPLLTSSLVLFSEIGSFYVGLAILELTLNL